MIYERQMLLRRSLKLLEAQWISQLILINYKGDGNWYIAVHFLPELLVGAALGLPLEGSSQLLLARYGTKSMLFFETMLQITLSMLSN